MIVASPQHRIPDAEELGRLPDHTNLADLTMMAEAMLALEGEARKFFAVEMVGKGLMGFMIDEADAVGKMLMEQAQAQNALPAIAQMMFSLFPEELDAMVEMTAKHCVSGTDQTDPKSAGGWNAEELATAYASLYVARGGLSIPFGANVQ